MLFIISDINALKTVDVFWKTRFSDMCFPSLNGLHQGIMNEQVLLLCLNQVIPLSPDVEQVRKDIHISAGDDLLQHGMHHNVAPCATHSSTEKRENYGTFFFKQQ